jgi:hypothetical protein
LGDDVGERQSDNSVMETLGLGLADEVATDVRPPLHVIASCVEALAASWDLLDAPCRAELLAAALRSARELDSSLQGLEARLEATAGQRLGLHPL